MIPKIIHYVWLGGDLPEPYKSYVEGWRALMPDYTFIKWDENNFDLSECRYSQEAYDCKKYGFAADYIRVSVLEKYGGFYLDTDVEAVRAFDDLLDNQFVIGFENDANVGTAVLGAQPHHPLCSVMLQFYREHGFVNRKGKMNMIPNTMYFTYYLRRGYGLKLQPIFQLLSNGESEVTVFGVDRFSPMNFNTKKINVTDNTYAIHRFANSWSSKSLKRSQNFVNGIRRVVGKKIFAAISRAYVRVGCRTVARYGRKKP